MPAEPSHLGSLPVGSSAYYIARLATPRARPTTTAALLFEQELRRSVARCIDPGATRLKLDWWRKELADAAHSRHPLALALAPLADHPVGQAALRAMLDATDVDITCQQPANAQAFYHHCDKAGRLADLLCLAADQPCDASALGNYAAAVHRIQTLGRHLQRGHHPLPADSAAGRDPAHCPAAALSDTCEQLLAPLRDRALAVLTDRATRTRPARRLGAIAHARHRLLARERYPVREQLLDITPIAKLWTAWRVR